MEGLTSSELRCGAGPEWIEDKKLRAAPLSKGDVAKRKRVARPINLRDGDSDLAAAQAGLANALHGLG